MSEQLLNQVALVTGAGKRIGRVLALRLAREGADVVVHYRSSRAEADEVVKAIEGLGRRGVALGADLIKVSEIERLFEQVKARFGRLDILVNSAASFVSTDFGSTTEQQWA